MTITRTWPGGVLGAIPDAYGIPEQGEKNWYALTDFLVALAEGAQGTTFQRMSYHKYTSSPITVSLADCVVSVAISPTGSASVNLPSGSRGAIIYVVDEIQVADTNPITIIAFSGQQVNGGSSIAPPDKGFRIGLCYNIDDLNWVIFSYGSY